MKAPEILKRASGIMDERAKQYDSPEGERSMGKAVAAFNAITGKSLSEANGWLLMALLKMVRDNTKAAPHEDSIHDLVAYGALYGEARLSNNYDSPASEAESDWIEWGGGERPVGGDVLVEVRFRDGRAGSGRASDWLVCWLNDNCGADIIAYRILE